jgi:DNA-binding MarR family transcriptional regulator
MKSKRTDEDDPIKTGLRGLNKLLGHRTRLGICVLLGRNDRLSFRRLKELLEETDGSLGAQLRKLEDESLIEVKKEFRDRKPVSWYAITDHGRATLDAHLEAMQQLMKE